MAYNPYTPYMPPMYQQNVNNDRLAYLQQFQQAQPQQQAYNQGLLWVQGEAGAKSYLVAPGASVLLMDSEASKFYIKSADNAGMPQMRTFEYKEVLANSTPQSAEDPIKAEYATQEEMAELKRQIEELKQKLEEAHESTVSNPKRRAKSSNDVWTGEADERI